MKRKRYFKFRIILPRSSRRHLEWGRVAGRSKAEPGAERGTELGPPMPR